MRTYERIRACHVEIGDEVRIDGRWHKVIDIDCGRRRTFSLEGGGTWRVEWDARVSRRPKQEPQEG